MQPGEVIRVIKDINTDELVLVLAKLKNISNICMDVFHYILKGSSKNYVTARGGRISTILLHIVTYFLGEGGLLPRLHVVQTLRISIRSR